MYMHAKMFDILSSSNSHNLLDACVAHQIC